MFQQKNGGDRIRQSVLNISTLALDLLKLHHCIHSLIDLMHNICHIGMSTRMMECIGSLKPIHQII